jgi:hypothetical protein
MRNFTVKTTLAYKIMLSSITPFMPFKKITFQVYHLSFYLSVKKTMRMKTFIYDNELNINHINSANIKPETYLCDIANNYRLTIVISCDKSLTYCKFINILQNQQYIEMLS